MQGVVLQWKEVFTGAPIPELLVVYETNCGVGRAPGCAYGSVQQLLFWWPASEVDRDFDQLCGGL